MKMKVKEISDAVSGSFADKFGDIEVSSVGFDSRKLKHNSLFVPLKGENDGHRFIGSAKKQGAAVTFCDRDEAKLAPKDFPVIYVDDSLKALQKLSAYYLKKIHPQVVAITGSNGKTTTKDLTASVLSTQYKVSKTPANFNNEIGVPITILDMDPDCQVLVVEIGMDHFGQLSFLSKLVQPDVCAITMIGEAHIEFFKTRDRIADAKMEITEGLKADGTFIYNGDEPLLRERAKTVKQAQWTFGTEVDDDLHSDSITANQTSTSFTTNLWPSCQFTMPISGAYNVNNALIALSVGRLFKISEENLKKGLSDVNFTENRTEWETAKNGAQILSDVYNSNPTALKAVLNSFSQTQLSGKRIAVLGDMLELGDSAKEMHEGIADNLDPKKIAQVYLIGSDMKALYDKLVPIYGKTNVHYYETKKQSQLITDLKANVNGNDQILLKASHGLHLEKVLDALK